ncbi:hypothetical protein ACVNS2_33605 [Paenibacillus caseinilyticus]|uniref:hypothetical protein n=1 Tax=Paenibacillus mucilaginosus TaxID=61624 RepID=UPI000FFE43AF|nr:hypothetical protein [Paenibacillus mucilaginosus]
MASLPPTYGNSTAYLKNIAFGCSAACSKYATFGCSTAYDYNRLREEPSGWPGRFFHMRNVGWGTLGKNRNYGTQMRYAFHCRDNFEHSGTEIRYFDEWAGCGMKSAPIAHLSSAIVWEMTGNIPIRHPSSFI